MIGGQVVITCIQGCPDEDPFLFLTSQRLLIPEDLTWSPAHPGASCADSIALGFRMGN